MTIDKPSLDWLHGRVKYLDEVAAIAVVNDWVEEEGLALSDDEIEWLISYARFGPAGPPSLDD